MRIKQRLTDALKLRGVYGHKLFEKHIPASKWTDSGDPFNFDFGYRALQAAGKPNGHTKLIHALSLRRDNELAKALIWTFNKITAREAAELAVLHEDLVEPLDAIVRSSRSVLEGERVNILPISRADEFAESVRASLMTSP
jgi:hypothetical protein